jgi:hypothetical protein
MKYIKYFLYFIAIYYVVSVAAIIVGGLLDIKLGGPAQLAGMVAGGIVAGRSFFPIINAYQTPVRSGC